MNGDERSTAPGGDDEEDWEEARRTPLDAYSWLIFFLLLAIVACLVLLSYAVITQRAARPAVLPSPIAVAAASPGRMPESSGTSPMGPITQETPSLRPRASRG